MITPSSTMTVVSVRTSVVVVDRDDVARRSRCGPWSCRRLVVVGSGKVARVCTSSSRMASTFAALPASTASISSIVIGSVDVAHARGRVDDEGDRGVAQPGLGGQGHLGDAGHPGDVGPGERGRAGSRRGSRSAGPRSRRRHRRPGWTCPAAEADSRISRTDGRVVGLEHVGVHDALGAGAVEERHRRAAW